jgi:quinoprotein glucose dehydrogenase
VPVVSIDGKKKEFLGSFYREGKLWVPVTFSKLVTLGFSPAAGRLWFTVMHIKLGAAILTLTLTAYPAPAEEFELSLWAREPLLKNPVSISFDRDGRLYVAETARRGSVDLDIRSHKPWVLEDLANQSVDDFRAFARRRIALELSEETSAWLPDHNGDGSHDWKDLTAITDTIRVLEDTDGDGSADTSRVYAEDFNEEITGVLEGVFWGDSGDVFATIFPDLWRLRDTDGDGSADFRESVFRGFGVHAAFDGHDIHGLTLGPDGKLYFSVGDNGTSLTNKEGQKIHHPNTGGVFRCNFDGTDLDVFATGLRNPQEIAFDKYGYLFTVDNDGDLEDERERFVYIAEGSDSGWRLNWQFRTSGWAKHTRQPNYNPWIADGMWKPHFPGQPAYITPPLSNYSVGPGGFRYNPGTALTERYRDHFFLVQFPVAKITAFRAEPRGAGFGMVDEHIFHQGLMASCVEWSHDGAMFIADWDGKWQPNEKGAIYSLDNREAARQPIRREVATFLREGLGNKPDDTLVKLLGHPDQRIRLRAQFELVKREKVDALHRVTLSRAPQLARIHALWGLGQMKNATGILTSDLALPFTDSDPEIRGQAAKTAGNLRWRQAAQRLVTLLNDSEPRVQFQSAIALGKLRQSEAIPALIELLANNRNRDPFLRHAAVMGLAGIGDGEILGSLATHPSKSVRLGAVVALRRMKHPMVQAFLADNDAAVAREAARAIHDDFSIPAALPAVANLLGSSSFAEDEAIVRRAISANLRLGQTENAKRLARYASDPNEPESMRVEALDSLAAWDHEPFVDRVTGRVRKPPARLAGAGQDAIRNRLLALVASGGKSMSEAIARVAGAAGIESGNQAFAKWALSADQPAPVRIAAMRALNSRDAPQLNAVLDAGLASDDTGLRIASLKILNKRQPAKALSHLVENFSNLSVPETESVLNILAEAANVTADDMIATKFEALLTGKLPLALELDVVEVAAKRSDASPSLQKLMTQYQTSSPGTRFALHGGNPATGRELFYNHVAAQCVRCHSIGTHAPGVGPDLEGIGKRFDRAYLLQSLVEPGKVIAEGYALITIIKNDGTTVAGTLVKETDEDVTIAIATGDRIAVSVSEIRERKTLEVSSMPPMLGILTKRELRDVLAFLNSLKE